MLSLENHVLIDGRLISIYDALFCSKCFILTSKLQCKINSYSSNIFYCPSCHFEPSQSSLSYSITNGSLMSLKCPRSCFKCLCGSNLQSNEQNKLKCFNCQRVFSLGKLDEESKRTGSNLTSAAGDAMKWYKQNVTYVCEIDNIVNLMKSHEEQLQNTRLKSARDVQVEQVSQWLQKDTEPSLYKNTSRKENKDDIFQQFRRVSDEESHQENVLLNELDYLTLGDDSKLIPPQPVQLKIKLSYRCQQCDSLLLKPKSILGNKVQTQIPFSIRSVYYENLPFLYVKSQSLSLQNIKSGEKLICQWINKSLKSFEVKITQTQKIVPGINLIQVPTDSRLVKIPALIEIQDNEKIFQEFNIKIDHETAAIIECQINEKKHGIVWINIDCLFTDLDSNKKIDQTLYIPLLIR